MQRMQTYASFSPTKLTIAPALAGVAVMLVADPATVFGASITLGGRDSTQVLSFSDVSAFSDATLSGNSLFSMTGNTGDSLTLGYLEPHGATGFTATVPSGFSVTAPVLSTGSPNDTETFTVTALNTPSAGSLTIASQLGVNIAPAGALTGISTGVSGGYHYLEGTYNPLANQTAGLTFDYTLDIPGNYSGVGTVTGDHGLVSVNGAWTITQNFVFNGTDTVFSASINNYNPALDQIGLDYKLYGAPAVPLPATLWLMLSGTLGLAAFAWRRANLGITETTGPLLHP